MGFDQTQIASILIIDIFSFAKCNYINIFLVSRIVMHESQPLQGNLSYLNYSSRTILISIILFHCLTISLQSIAFHSIGYQYQVLRFSPPKKRYRGQIKADINQKQKLFHCLSYFCYYLWISLYFLILFISHTVLFQLFFTFIYGTFSNKFLISTK